MLIMNQKEKFFQEMDSCNKTIRHMMEDTVNNPSLETIDELHGKASILSMENAKLHNRLLLLFSAIGTVITFLFLLYDEAELHGLIFLCIVLIIILYIIQNEANFLDCHRKYLEYRVLAESLRVQYFLSYAGIDKKVTAILPWFTRESIPWVEEILQSIEVIPSKSRQSIMDCWIKDQKGYHQNALAKDQNDKKNEKRITQLVFIITISTFLVTLGFEVYVYLHSPLSINPNIIRAILKVVVGTMSALALFASSYYGKKSLYYDINNHKRMISLYDKAETDILEQCEDEELLIELAREFLIENSTWYAFQSKNEANIVL